MRRDCPAFSQNIPRPRRSLRIWGALAASALPLNAAFADVAPQAAEAGGFVFDAQTAVLIVLAIGTAWALSIAVRRYGQGAQKLGTTKRDRMQPNL